MKNIMTKRVVIIFSVLLTVILTMLIIALVTGQSNIPQLTDPEGIFYERVDDSGNVIYSITNQEIFEELKSSDGIEQLLYLIDSHLLQAYMAQVSDADIQAKIKELKFGTSDDTLIADLTADQIQTYEDAYEQSMILAGFAGDEENYARLVLAKEAYTRYAADQNDVITEKAIASEYVFRTFDDIKAIRIRFASLAEATAQLQKYNLVAYQSKTLRMYLGYTFTNESLLDDQDQIVEAYVTVDVYYTNADGDLLNLDDEVIYTYGTNVYTNDDGDEFTKDDQNNLIDEDSEIVVEAAHIFATEAEAQTYFDANTHYYTVTKTNSYDAEEAAKVYDGDTLLYTIDKDGKIYDTTSTDVTSTTDLIVNKKYKAIANMGTVTVNNSQELTEAEVLSYYIRIYNDIYSDYRTQLPVNATQEDLIGLPNDDLVFNFDKVNASSSSLAKYMFYTLNLSNDETVPYMASASSYTQSNNSYYFLVYKLTQPTKNAIYETILDQIESTIVLPAQTVTDLTLPTTSWFDSTITWTSSNTGVLSAKGVVTIPENDTNVTLTYKITLDGVTRSDSTIVKVLKEGTTSEIVPSTLTQPVIKTLIANDDLYDQIYNDLLDAYVADTSTDNVSAALVALRNEFGFAIFDKFLGVDYSATDSDFEYDTKGDEFILATLTGYPGYLDAAATTESYALTADQFFNYAMDKNAALYTLYASQFKEILYSDYFVQIFGEQRDLTKNKSDKIDEIYDSIRSQKMTYLSYKAMYEQYGISFDYADFASFARYQYGTKSEMDLLRYLVKGVLQPFFIDEAITEEDLVDLLVATVEDNYNNYFSLNVTHLIMYVDFNEDGTPDDYNDYIASLDATDLAAFNALKAGLEADVLEYLDDADNTFATLITAYTNDTRQDDSEWGAYKNAGIWLMTEDLNIEDSEDDTITHSLQYSGEYGVKDTYVPEYVDALVALYQEYQLEQNQDLDQLYSPLVTTQFGVHLILASKGDDFERFSAMFTDTNTAYPDEIINPNGAPSLDQLKLYAQYYMYSLVYDLEDTEIEQKYNITIPTFPNDVREALEFYFDDLLGNLYVVGTLNIQMANRMVDGTFQSSDYSELTNAELQAKLATIRQTYYDALFGKYID